MSAALKRRYHQSGLLYKRALQTIPLASQTFSKSTVFYPECAAPLFIQRGAGSRVWDVDGNEYIDFVNGLGAVLIGYNDEQVNEAVCKQLQNGVTFTLPHPLEAKVAETLVKMIPSAEMVRFGKNGSDVTSAAVRLARAFTGRDHIATGFRVAGGGAQEFLGVTPDLTTLGKGMGNGFPISAIVGRADIMRWMEKIFFSGTFGGETLSLAAAESVLQKIICCKVPDVLRQRGELLMGGLKNLLRERHLEEIFQCEGYPAQVRLSVMDAGGFTSWEIRTLLLQEIFVRGILTLGTHNLSYAHSDRDIWQLLNVYGEVLPLVCDAVAKRRLREMLQSAPLKPLFQVRQ